MNIIESYTTTLAGIEINGDNIKERPKHQETTTKTDKI